MKIVNKTTGKIMRCPLSGENLIPSNISVDIYDDLVDNFTTMHLCRSPSPKVPKGFYWDIDTGSFYTGVPEVMLKSELADNPAVKQDTLAFLHSCAYTMFKGGSRAALGTLSRQLDTSIFKKGLKDGFAFPFLFGYQLYIEYKYNADYDGNVTKRSYSLQYNYKEDEHTIMKGLWAVDTWNFLWYSALQNKDKGNIKAMFEPKINRSWKYRLFETFLKIRFWKLYKNIKNI